MKFTQTFCVSAVLALCAGPILAQAAPPEGPVPTSALISVDSKNPIELDPRALNLQLNGKETPIDSLNRAVAGRMEIAILLDDGLRRSFGQLVTELGSFVNALPPNANVLVGYMQNGAVRSSGHFSADHQEIVGQLRITSSVAGSSASPYFCLSDFSKHWPSEEPASRFVLMITNGVDPYNPGSASMNQASPYVNTAMSDAQRAGIAVYSIYFPNAGDQTENPGLSGQSYLQQIGDATGGTLFNNGTVTPTSIMPFLNQFGRAIFASYEVSFKANAGKRDALIRMKVKTSQSGVKLRAPQWVRPGFSAQPATSTGG
jgi:hypothetical protein